MTPDLVQGAMWYGAFLFSTVCHEAAHAWSALKMGDDTAAKGGQVTLNPVPHIRREPFGMVVVPILSFLLGGWLFGWASAPYDPQWARQYPRRAALMALAGPATNLTLALLALLLIRVGYEWHFFRAPFSVSSTHLAVAVQGGLAEFLAPMLSIMVSLNLLLCLFNLMPLPPLDGSSAPLLFLPPGAAEKYTNFMRHPALSYLGIFLASRLVSPILPRMLLGVASMLYPSMSY
ncbi:MAG TPA: site-2 protease family protein [Lacunisphaera sp.]|nr:site-2 protease family protein [Lacunisphaera sp.]